MVFQMVTEVVAGNERDEGVVPLRASVVRSHLVGVRQAMGEKGPKEKELNRGEKGRNHPEQNYAARREEQIQQVEEEGHHRNLENRGVSVEEDR